MSYMDVACDHRIVEGERYHYRRRDAFSETILYQVSRGSQLESSGEDSSGILLGPGDDSILEAVVGCDSRKTRLVEIELIERFDLVHLTAPSHSDFTGLRTSLAVVLKGLNVRFPSS